MTFSLNLTNITNAIAALSISGVTIKDVDEIAASWKAVPNVLYPNPRDDGFITDFGLDYASTMRGASAPVNVRYVLHYRFLGMEVGDLSTFKKAYSDTLSKLISIINALEEVSAPYSGAVDMEIVAPINIGARPDPAGNMYHGADIALKITEIH